MARSQSQSAIRNPITYIFGVDSNVAVLRELVRHGGALSSADIRRRSGVSKSSVRIGLIVLEQLGLVRSEGSHVTRLHRFNQGSDLAEQISELFHAEANRFTSIVEIIRGCAEHNSNQIRSVWIYGSVARKEDRPGSDLDIAMLVEIGEVSQVIEAVRENLREPAERFGFVPNLVGLDLGDVARLVKISDPWWTSLANDAVVVMGELPDTVQAQAEQWSDG